MRTNRGVPQVPIPIILCDDAQTHTLSFLSCAGADSKVIKALAEAYPECKTAVDRRGRTPLHFALGDKPANPDVVLLLSTSGAAGYADDNGMVRVNYEHVLEL